MPALVRQGESDGFEPPCPDNSLTWALALSRRQGGHPSETSGTAGIEPATAILYVATLPMSYVPVPPSRQDFGWGTPSTGYEPG